LPNAADRRTVMALCNFTGRAFSEELPAQALSGREIGIVS